VTDAPAPAVPVEPAAAEPVGSRGGPAAAALARLCAVVVFVTHVAHQWLLGPGGAVGPLDARESQVGVLAVRLARDGPWALWEWSGPLNVAWEAIIHGALWQAESLDVATLRWIPLVLNALAAAWMLWLADRWLGPRAALACALVGACVLPGVGAVQARAWGGLALGTLVAVWSLGGASSLTVARPRTRSFGAGFGAGLAVTAHLANAPLAVGVAVAAAAGLSAVVVHPSRLLAALDHAARFVLGAVLGLLPVLMGPGLEALVPGVDAAGAAQPERLLTAVVPAMGGWVAVVAGVVVLASVPSLLARWATNGFDQAGLRMGLGALGTVAACGWLLWRNPPATFQAFMLAVLPGLTVLPALAAQAVTLPRVWPGVLGACALGWAGSNLTSVPPDADVDDVGPVVTYLDQHPGAACLAEASAAGPRAYVFRPGEQERVAQLEADLGGAHRPILRAVAGAFMVRVTDGASYPPDVPLVVSEHARRNRRALMDGDLTTAVATPAGSAAEVEMVWPTSLAAVVFFPDARALHNAACSARADIQTANGRWDSGTVVNLERACQLARRWNLWPVAGWGVRLPVPGAEATHIRIQTLDDDGGVLTASEVRVLSRTVRTR
jgi:hypothetical protein